MSAHPEEIWTLLAVLNAADRFLASRGIDNSRGEAEQLLTRVLQLTRLELYLQHDRPLDQVERASYKKLLRRRVQGEPLQYLIGSVEVLGYALEVGPGVLIPRPETEILLVEALRLLEPMQHPWVLDAGAGSGTLAVVLAKRSPLSYVFAVELSPHALRYTVRNAKRHDVGGRLLAGGADYGRLPVRDGAFDLLVSNPPYIASALVPGLQREIAEHEPHLALDGGEDGLDAYRCLIPEAARVLHAGGALALEIGRDQGRAVASLCSRDFEAVVVRRDLTGHERVVTARRK